ncbi:MAG: M48 family metallopeptidase, partial [Crocosphaera sp.]
MNLNYKVVHSSFVIDYVVVHELAHLLEANHTARFWNIIKSQIANMERAKKWLK